jgi:hypothetical protein
MAEHRTRKISTEKKTHGNVIKYGDRMKETFVRSKHTARNLSKDGHENATNYAVDNTTEGSRELARDIVRVANPGVRKTVERGRKAAKQAKAKKQEEERLDGTQGVEPDAPDVNDEGEAPTAVPEGETLANKKELQQKELLKQKTATVKQSGKDVIPSKPAEAKPPATLNPNPNDPKMVNARTELSQQRNDATLKPDVVKGMQNNRPVVAPKQNQNPQYPKYTARRESAGSHVVVSGRVEPRGTVNRHDTGRNSRGLRTAAANQAGRAAQDAVRQEQGRQAFMMAKQKAIASARTQRSVRKRLAAVVEQTRKAAASIGAIAGGAGMAIVVFMVILFLVAAVATSGFGIFLSPDANKQSEQKMPAVIREINTEFQNKIENIKATVPHDAVEMYGARATWKEVLAVYAVKTTTDPTEGMEVATMNEKKKNILKGIFWDMNTISYDTRVESHVVTSKTANADGTVTEKAETVYTTTLIITVSHKTADEAADAYRFKKSQKDELQELIAMDNSLWNAVLYGIIGGNGHGSEMVQVALSQIGNIGGEPYWSWYGFSSRVEWCACFVSWCADQCGYIEDGLVPLYAWCPYGVEWFKDRQQWLDKYDVPESGMIIFYDWNKESTGGQDGVADHTGIVEYVENGIVHTVEGNYGDSVAQREFPIGYYEVLGYGYMAGGS